MNTHENIRLAVYETKYDKQLDDFFLPPNQLRFTALPKEMVELSNDDPTRNPIVILSEQKPVGFFVLQSGKRPEELVNSKHALLLTSFSINSVEQGKGYAKRGLQILREFVLENYLEITEVVLTVNMKNISARALYEKVGFIDEGLKRMGEIGEQAILRLPLK